MSTPNSISILSKGIINFENFENKFIKKEYEIKNKYLKICKLRYYFNYDMIVEIKDSYWYNGMINFKLTDGNNEIEAYIKDFYLKGEKALFLPTPQDIGKKIKINYLTYAQSIEFDKSLKCKLVILDFNFWTEENIKKRKRKLEEEEEIKKKNKPFHKNEKVSIEEVLLIPEDKINSGLKIFRSVTGTIKWIESLKTITTKKNQKIVLLNFLLSDNGLNSGKTIKCSLWGLNAAFFEKTTKVGETISLYNWQVCSYNDRNYLYYVSYRSSLL